MIKVAIVYDWIDKWGGVERLLLVLNKMYPAADFFTSYYDKESASWANKIKIKTSFLQKFPQFIKKNRVFSFIFYPFAFESFNFSKYDLVISISSSFAKGVVTKPETKHICYLLTPTRYLWITPKDYFKNKIISFFLKPYINYIKKWDLIAAKRPEIIISISKTVAERCKKYYHQESEVIYPPFDEEYWNEIKLKLKNQKSKLYIKNQNFYLVVSRLEPYKKVELVVRTFNHLNEKLIIVGEGSEEDSLKKIAKNNIQFFKKLTDFDLGYLYSHARALIMPQNEDFGYISLEAMLFDCPVIAFSKGGATETIIDKKNGLFFSKQSERSLLQALERFSDISYNLKRDIKNNKQNFINFSKKNFIKNFRKVCEL